MSEELKARIAELEQQAATDADFIRQYQRETEALRGQIVSSWDMDEIPTFRQGAPIHEMEGLVTAEEVTGYVRRITEQREQIAELERQLAESRDFAVSEAAKIRTAYERQQAVLIEELRQIEHSMNQAKVPCIELPPAKKGGE